MRVTQRLTPKARSDETRVTHFSRSCEKWYSIGRRFGVEVHDDDCVTPLRGRGFQPRRFPPTPIITEIIRGTNDPRRSYKGVLLSAALEALRHLSQEQRLPDLELHPNLVF